MAEENKKSEQTVVDEHRKMLMMTGNLSDFQLENLKTWPFIVFDSILEKTSVKYDFTKMIDKQEALSAGTVIYDFTFKPKTKMDREETKKKLAILKLWTQFLFWQDTVVEFQTAGKKWEV